VNEALTWRETRSRLRADRRRLAASLGRDGGGSWVTLIHPSFVCAFLYRLSHHLHRSGRRFLARMCWQFNTLLTGADISPPSDLGEGLLIVNPPGTAISGSAGRNLTVMPSSGMGAEVGRRQDIGAGPGLPLLGDDVVLGAHTGVLGPVRIGHRVHIKTGAVVTFDVPQDTVVEGPVARMLRRKDLT
jgi:serine O-acetyltransferase